MGLALAAAAGLGAAEAGSSSLRLWYDQPAADWEHEGLPIGNGALGAMVMGGVALDEIQFNEKSLWTGGPRAVGGYDAGLPKESQADKLAQIRALLAQDPKLAPEKAAAILGHQEVGPGAYQNFGSLKLTVPGSAAVAAYRRSLDIGRAVATVEYSVGGVQYTRTYFASYPAGVIVVRLAADRPGKIAFTVAFVLPDNRTRTVAVRGGRIAAAGALKDNAEKYEAQVHVLTTGGKRIDGADGTVTVTGADSAVLILSAGTDYAPHYPDYLGPDPHAAVTARIEAAAAQGYDGLLAAHEKDVAALMGRVSLDIGTVPDKPTDVLLADYRADASSPAARGLEALFFQYGRYLLIASSRAGSLPANLQGVWNHSTTPPWEDDYHVNINLQMNYWPADPTNIAEAAAPFYDFVDGLVAPGKVAAERILGAKGWTLFLKTNIWGQTGMIAWPTAFWQPEAGAWLASQYYDHYRFTRDAEFLKKRAYPVMKAAAQTWLDTLTVDPDDGSLVVSPSYSPEHGPFSNGAAISQQIVYGLFADTAEAAGLVGDTAWRNTVMAAQAMLDPGTRIGSWGQLQEWKRDWDNPKDDHRHTSHLYGLHPGRQISPAATPDLAAAARVSLLARGDSTTANGEAGTGWSKAWKINFWARLADGDHAHALLVRLIRENAMANLWDAYVGPPFQIDGNFGATAGVAEMLLQSQAGEIALLPALPAAWAQGAERGLRARGDVTVDIVWKAGKAAQATLTAGRDGTVRVRTSIFAGPFVLVDGEGRPVAANGEGDVRTISLRAGGRYVLAVRP
jgi:alpha-L-fucosidase 2